MFLRQAIVCRSMGSRILLSRKPLAISRTKFAVQKPIPNLLRARRGFTTQKPVPEPAANAASEERLSSKLMYERLTELDKRLSYQGWHTLRWTSLIFVVAGTTFWFFREHVSSGVGDAASEVTRRTLENQDVQHQASELARGVVYQLLNDKRALELSAQFLTEVIQREETKAALLTLLQDVLSRKETEVALRGLVSNVLTHQESAAKAVEFLQHVVAIPESRDALVTVLTAVLAQPTTQQITSDFFRNVMESERFTTASNKLGADTVHNLLNNEELKMTAVEWCNAVLNDPALQSTAGDAVWAAVKGAFVPWSKRKHQDQQQQQTPSPKTPSKVILLPVDAAELATTTPMSTTVSEPEVLATVHTHDSGILAASQASAAASTT